MHRRRQLADLRVGRLRVEAGGFDRRHGGRVGHILGAVAVLIDETIVRDRPGGEVQPSDQELAVELLAWRTMPR
jgi:hypothetical protein